MKIGLFDSGLGGINVLNELLKTYPNNEYIYYGDTKNLPYGNKTKVELLSFAKEIISFFEKKQVDLIIIACGTMSSNCLKEIKEMTNIKVIDIISPTINYLKEKEYNKILVFGTNRTIESHIFSNKLSNVIEISTPEFVPMIENNNIDETIIAKYLENNLDVDYLILGCTHYPLLISYFNKYLKNTKIIDMGKVLIKNINLSNNCNSKISLYFTKIDNNLKENLNNIIIMKYYLYEI